MSQDRKTLEAIRDALIALDKLDASCMPCYAVGLWGRNNLDAMRIDVEAAITEIDQTAVALPMQPYVDPDT